MVRDRRGEDPRHLFGDVLSSGRSPRAELAALRRQLAAAGVGRSGTGSARALRLSQRARVMTAIPRGCFGLVAVLGVTLSAQAPGPAFEVVSIKINKTVSRSSGMGPRPGGGIAATNSTVRSLI